MTASAPSSPSAGRPPAAVAARRPGRSLGVRLVEGAHRRLEIARDCIQHGGNPRRPVRSAMLRITRFPATLAPTDEASIANLADLSAYMCRELSSVAGAEDLSTLGRMCDLLREIRCAWGTPPAASTRM
jgi:flagellin-specific chaperone FliS